jgi:hypothetical protein
MKRVMTMLGIVGFCSVAAIASAQTTPAAKPMAKKAAAATATTVTGCVAAGADAKHFTLTGDDKTAYTLVGGTLKPHVGHKVEVTGTPTKAAATTLHVKSVKMVAASCS